MPLETYILKVIEYDFEQDGDKFVPSAREIEYMYSTFAVRAFDREDAINKVSNRTGWCIKSCEFIGDEDTNVFPTPDSL